MAMEDGLARHLSDIDPDIEASGIWIACEDFEPDLLKEFVDRPLFGEVEIEIAGHVPPRQYQTVEWGNRCGIAHGEGERVRDEWALRGHRAEDAIGLVGSGHMLPLAMTNV
jgi:hypothetical protein